METFSTSQAICVGNSPVTSEFLAPRPVMQSFDIFFDLHLNKRFSKPSWGWLFETPSCPLWHHCNVTGVSTVPPIFDCTCYIFLFYWLWGVAMLLHSIWFWYISGTVMIYSDSDILPEMDARSYNDIVRIYLIPRLYVLMCKWNYNG